MRLSEITDQNKTLLILSNLSEDYNTTYFKLEQYAQILIQQKTLTRNKYFLPMFNEFVDELDKFLNTEFLPDPDIQRLKEDVLVMKKRLTELMFQL